MAQSSNTMSSAVSSSQSGDGLTAAMLAMVTMFDKKNDEVKKKAEELENADRRDKELAKFDRFLNSIGRVTVDGSGEYVVNIYENSELAQWLFENLPPSMQDGMQQNKIKEAIANGAALTGGEGTGHGRGLWVQVDDWINQHSNVPDHIRAAWKATGSRTNGGTVPVSSELVKFITSSPDLSSGIKEKMYRGEPLTPDELEQVKKSIEKARDDQDGGANSKIQAVELDVLVSELNFFLNMMKETVSKHNEGLQTVSKNW